MQKWNWKICVLNTFGIVMINSIRDFYLGLLKCCFSLKCLHQKLMSMAMRKRWTMKIRVLRIGVTVRSLGVECTGCTNTIAQNGVVVMHWVLIYHICDGTAMGPTLQDGRYCDDSTPRSACEGWYFRVRVRSERLSRSKCVVVGTWEALHSH